MFAWESKTKHLHNNECNEHNDSNNLEYLDYSDQRYLGHQFVVILNQTSGKRERDHSEGYSDYTLNA